MREDLVDACLDIGLGFGLVEPAIKDIEVSARFRLIDEQSRIMQQSQPSYQSIKVHWKSGSKYLKSRRAGEAAAEQAKTMLIIQSQSSPLLIVIAPACPSQILKCKNPEIQLTRPRQGCELCQC